ncbi:unnamed protein product [Phyllotreta striolata]|uniref:Uncharacterized protein n=1 Tax=Phyllotreta striolata TaxID=444603 RepID=A0A9N9TSF0_PHYSR|nr:unnamed protein product [Phyllotreta striolata]
MLIKGDDTGYKDLQGNRIIRLKSGTKLGKSSSGIQELVTNIN